jgi:ribosomal protein L1
MAEADEQNEVGPHGSMAQVQPGTVGDNVAEQTDVPAASETTDRSRQGSVEEAVEKDSSDRGVADPMETVATDPD